MAKTLQLNEPEKTIRVRMPIWVSEQIKLRASRRGISRHQLVSKWLSERLDADEARRKKRKRRKTTG